MKPITRLTRLGDLAVWTTACALQVALGQTTTPPTQSSTPLPLPLGFTYETVRSFGFPELSGASPWAALLQGRDGALYGTTYEGGSGPGTVFKLNPNTGDYTVLKRFGTSKYDGAGPKASLLQGNDGALYGTTVSGGTNGLGTVFKLQPDGSDYTVLRSFSNTGDDGNSPYAALIQGSDGALYGTTLSGGTAGSGTVFKLRPDGSDYTVVRSFSNTGGDGTSPYAALVQGSDGALYGTTYSGGSGYAGTAFRLNPDGSGYTVLKSFGTTAGDGSYPYAALVQGSDGALYGTTASGGDMNFGTVFRLTPPPSPRLALQRVLNDATALRAGVTNKNDALILDKAIGPLTAALAPSCWLDDTHLVVKQGKVVFDELKDVAGSLALPERTVPAETLQDLLNRVFLAARQLVTTEIADTAAAQGDVQKLSDAQTALAQADAMRTGAKPKEALVCLKNAWDKAATSMH